MKQEIQERTRNKTKYNDNGREKAKLKEKFYTFKVRERPME